MPERAEERLVGGLWCREVMELLPDFVEGQLAPDAAARLVAHVGGCPLCERFGGTYGAVVRRLRGDAMPEDAGDRLLAALDRAITEG